MTRETGMQREVRVKRGKILQTLLGLASRTPWPAPPRGPGRQERHTRAMTRARERGPGRHA